VQTFAVLRVARVISAQITIITVLWSRFALPALLVTEIISAWVAIRANNWGEDTAVRGHTGIRCAQVTIITSYRDILAFTSHWVAKIRGAKVVVVALDRAKHAFAICRVAQVTGAQIAITTNYGREDAITSLRVAFVLGA
jgi:hypothetical protein